MNVLKVKRSLPCEALRENIVLRLEKHVMPIFFSHLIEHTNMDSPPIDEALLVEDPNVYY